MAQVSKDMGGVMRALYRKALPFSFRVAVRKVLTPNGGAAVDAGESPNKSNDWSRRSVADRYLSGNGIEIGALHSPLEVPESARVEYVDRMLTPDLRRHYPELASYELVDVDIVDDGELLRTVGDATQDFVIANHFIEHCQNPLLALSNMFRVLKPGGVLYMAVPDKRFTFDVDRPVTPFEHLLKDYREGPSWSKRQHFEEWVSLVKKIEDAGEAENQTNALFEKDYSIHFHVWTQAEMFELATALKREVGLSFDIELFLNNGGECIFIMRKLD